MASSGIKLTFVPFRLEVSSIPESVINSPTLNSAYFNLLSLIDSTLK